MIHLDQILVVVMRYYNVSMEEIFSTSRKERYVLARHVFFYLATKITNHSLSYIGSYSGQLGYVDFNHATIIHARNKIHNEYKIYDDFQQEVDIIVSQIYDDQVSASKRFSIVQQDMTKELKNKNLRLVDRYINLN